MDIAADIGQVTISWSNDHVFDCFLVLLSIVCDSLSIDVTCHRSTFSSFSVFMFCARTSGWTWAVDDRRPGMFRAVDLRQFGVFRADLGINRYSSLFCVM